MTDFLDQLFASLHNKKFQAVDEHEDIRATRKELVERIYSGEKYIVTDEMVESAKKLSEYPNFLIRNMTRAASMCAAPMIVSWHEEDRNYAVIISTLKSNSGTVEQVTYYKFDIFTEFSPFGSGKKLPCGLPISYMFCPDRDIDLVAPYAHQYRSEVARSSGLSKETLENFLICETGEEEKDPSENDMWRTIVTRGTFMKSLYWKTFIPEARENDIDKEDVIYLLRSAVEAFSGKWIVIVTLMIMLNMQEHVSKPVLQRNPAKRRFVGQKVVPYLQVWKVGLNYPKEIILREAKKNPNPISIPQPVTTIEGSWRSHHRNDQKCDHEDVPVAGKDRFFRCVHCKRARWRVDDYVRGDATVGFVKKIRVVKRKSK